MKYFDVSGAVSFLAVGVCEGPADTSLQFPCDDQGRQMAAGITHNVVEGVPIIVVTFVLGDRQVTATFDAKQADKFCHVLADKVLWQNDQLGLSAGQAVH